MKSKCGDQPRRGTCFIDTQGITTAIIVTLILTFAPGGELVGQVPAVVTTRCIAFELYMNSTDESAQASVDAVSNFIENAHGVKLKIYDLGKEDKEAKARMESIALYYKVPPALPIVYGLNRAFSGVAEPVEWNKRLNQMLRVEVFTRAGCSRCARAKEYLPTFMAKYPGLQVDVRQVIADPSANKRYSELASSQRMGGISFPGFWICQQLVVGFDSEPIASGRLDSILKKWTYDCELPPKRASGFRNHFRTLSGIESIPSQLSSIAVPALFLTQISNGQQGTSKATVPPQSPSPQDDQPSLEIGAGPEQLPLPLGIEPDDTINSTDSQAESPDVVDVPLLGRLSAKRLGMPAFTILIGLVDGFNPCAMWVLLFLLSVLVNLKDRWKILAVAGTFVVISGVAYFAFMAAWLNVLLLVGFLRWVQVLLAVLAVVVGTIHIKDFFAFKKGVSLSIPESSKPGIYSRVRRIVLAENLIAAIGGAVVLAILVNIIELLCTAGLPALYSQVLSLQNYPWWENYAYLSLYIVAYMLDDSIMVGIVVVTMGKKKLQEGQGRWLKLVSGLVILALGLVLLFKPEWLE